jgi:hypothetical protein
MKSRSAKRSSLGYGGHNLTYDTARFFLHTLFNCVQSIYLEMIFSEVCLCVCVLLFPHHTCEKIKATSQLFPVRNTKSPYPPVGLTSKFH